MHLKHSFDDENLRSIKIEIDKEESLLIKNDFLKNKINIDLFDKNIDSSIHSNSFLNNNYFLIKKKRSLSNSQENLKINEKLFDTYFEDNENNDYSLAKMFSNKDTFCTDIKSEKEISPISKNIKKNKSNNDNLLNRLNIGLKSLSLKVKEIVKNKIHTSYKEVSNIIIEELNSLKNYVNEKEKLNIKRRVYDALNVWISYGIIVKNNKKISFNFKFETFNFKEFDFINQYNIKNLIKNKKKFIKIKRSKNNYLKNIIKKLKEIINRNLISKSEKKINIPFSIINIMKDEGNDLKITQKIDLIKIKSKNEVNFEKYNIDIIKFIKATKNKKNKRDSLNKN